MFKALDKWLYGYLKSVCRRPRHHGRTHLIFCVADHFEPFRGHASKAEAMAAVRAWRQLYPAAVAGLQDADGCRFRHTFFYPADEYDPDVVDVVADLCREQYGELEIHLHHRHDTEASLAQKLAQFRDVLHQRHHVLGKDREGRVRYGFVHGNWSLGNSRPDGDWCGVNRELGVLSATGCYADFTFPSAPSPTQPRMVNLIYRARDTGRPRAADRGIAAACGAQHDDGLLLVTGPLALDWRNRKMGILPRLENGDVTGKNPATPARIKIWARQHIHVAGREAWVFVKIHTHGCVPANQAAWLGGAMRAAHEHLAAAWHDEARDRALHYVTAREMYNIIRAAEDGCDGPPGAFRNYEVGVPG